MLGVDRRTVARYLAGWCQRPSVKRDREAVRPYRAAIEASRARRGARGERRPGAWTADHERRRAVAVLVLLAAPRATHGSVAAAVGRSRRTVERWMNRARYPETLAAHLARTGHADLLLLRVVGAGADPRTLGELLAEAAEHRLSIRAAVRKRRRADVRRLALARELVAVLPHFPAAADALHVLRADREAAPVVLEHLAGELLAA